MPMRKDRRTKRARKRVKKHVKKKTRKCVTLKSHKADIMRLKADLRKLEVQAKKFLKACVDAASHAPRKTKRIDRSVKRVAKHFKELSSRVRKL